MAESRLRLTLATVQPFEINDAFGRGLPLPKIAAVNQGPLTHQWTVDFGAIHGFTPVQDKPLEFAILLQDSPLELELIEQGDGHKYIDHLILLDVPNGGVLLGKIGLAASAMRLLLTVAVNVIP